MKRDATATRQRILHHATAEFARYGIAGARVDRIAAAAGSNKAMLYAYFGSKDGLFDAVFDAVVVRNVTDIPIDATDLPEYAARLADQYTRYPEVVRLMAWDRLERGGEGARLPVVVAAREHKVAAVRRAQETGQIGDHVPPELVLDLIYAIATMRFDAIAPASGAPAPEVRRGAIKEAVTRLIRA